MNAVLGTTPRLNTSASSWEKKPIDNLLSVFLQRQQALHDLSDSSVPVGGRFGAIKPVCARYLYVCEREIQSKYSQIQSDMNCLKTFMYVCGREIQSKYSRIHTDMKLKIQSDTVRYSQIQSDMDCLQNAYVHASRTNIQTHTCTYALT